jgi:hypothetical protein
VLYLSVYLSVSDAVHVHGGLSGIAARVHVDLDIRSQQEHITYTDGDWTHM